MNHYHTNALLDRLHLGDTLLASIVPAAQNDWFWAVEWHRTFIVLFDYKRIDGWMGGTATQNCWYTKNVVSPFHPLLLDQFQQGNTVLPGEKTSDDDAVKVMLYS
jgi:hypothetical protein